MWCVKSLKLFRKQELLASTVGFISSRVVLRVKLAGVARWCSVERGMGWREGKMEWVLSDLYAGRLSGLEDKLVFSFKLDMVPDTTLPI